MILSTQTDFLGRAYGEAEAIRMLAKAGFDAYDFSFFPMFENPECSFARKTRNLCKQIEKKKGRLRG